MSQNRFLFALTYSSVLKFRLCTKKHVKVMTSNVLTMGAKLTLETLCMRNIPRKINNVHHSINC